MSDETASSTVCFNAEILPPQLLRKAPVTQVTGAFAVVGRSVHDS
jgi:hypothetical protein